MKNKEIQQALTGKVMTYKRDGFPNMSCRIIVARIGFASRTSSAVAYDTDSKKTIKTVPYVFEELATAKRADIAGEHYRIFLTKKEFEARHCESCNYHKRHNMKCGSFDPCPYDEDMEEAI